MSWYWWPLIYVVGALVSFRISYPRVLDDAQRYEVDYEKKLADLNGGLSFRRYDKVPHEDIPKRFKAFSLKMMTVGVLLWPIAAVIIATYQAMKWTVKGTYWVLFPRGVTTKFDREQKLLAEKKETEEKYEEAKRLLELEGITVE